MQEPEESAHLEQIVPQLKAYFADDRPTGIAVTMDTYVCMYMHFVRPLVFMCTCVFTCITQNCNIRDEKSVS